MIKSTSIENLNSTNISIPKEYYGFIYKTIFPNGKIYIGQTVNRIHITYFGSGIKCNNAINKYGLENLKREILKFVNNQNELNKWEQIFITKFDSTNSKVGYNIENKSFGKGRVSEETRKKLSLVSLGLKRSDETKLKMKLSALKRFENPIQRLNKSKPCSDETKQKLRLKSLGRKLSEESKLKISEAHKKRKLLKE